MDKSGPLPTSFPKLYCFARGLQTLLSSEVDPPYCEPAAYSEPSAQPRAAKRGAFHYWSPVLYTSALWGQQFLAPAAISRLWCCQKKARARVMTLEIRSLTGAEFLEIIL